MAMQPQQAPAQAAAPAEQSPEGNPPKGGVQELVSGIGSGLIQLMGLMDKSQVVDPQDKQQLGALIDGFQSLIEGMSKAPQPAAAKQNPIRSTATLEGGVTGKAMNPAGGNF